MDNKRKLDKNNQGEPSTKKIRRKPLSLAESFSTTVLPQEIKCLICARAIPPTRPETQILHDQVSTVKLLGQLFKALRLSPEVCQCLLQISYCSPVTVIYCESCEEAISGCLEMEQKIDNLHNVWEQMATKIKENVYQDNHCRVDSSGSGNGYIRKTLVQLAETARAESTRAASSGHNIMSTAVNNSFYIPVVNVALGGVVLPEYSSTTTTCVDTASFADKKIEEIGTPLRIPPLASDDLGEFNKTQMSTVVPSTFTIKLVDAESAQSVSVNEAREFLDIVNQKDGADKNDNASLTSGVSLSLPACHEQIVNYLCDVKIEENSDTGTGSVYGPDSPFKGEETACQDQDRDRYDPLLLGVKPKWTRKTTTKKNKILQIRSEHRDQEFPLNCSICGKGYHRKNILEKHEKAHEFTSFKSFEFHCPKCKHIRFASAQSLSSHIARAHKTGSNRGPGPGTTDADADADADANADADAIEEVGVVAETNDAKGAQDAPSADPSPAAANTNLDGQSLHKCPKCSLTFEDATDLRKHNKSRHYGFEKKISCPECIEKFASVTTARNHQIRIHGKSLKTALDDEGNLDVFQCVYCKEEFVKSTFIIEDNSTDPPTKKFSFPDLPPVSRSSIDEIANNETIDFKSFHWNHRKFCKSRPRIESVSDKLDVPNPAENICKFCGKEFANVDRCRNHEITVHTKDFKFHCDICGRPYPDKVSLRCHRYNVHSEKRLMCDQCPKIFKSNYELKNHMNMHNNIRSFICEHCGKGYCTRNVLYMHTKQSHKNAKKSKT